MNDLFVNIRTLNVCKMINVSGQQVTIENVIELSDAQFDTALIGELIPINQVPYSTMEYIFENTSKNIEKYKKNTALIQPDYRIITNEIQEKNSEIAPVYQFDDEFDQKNYQSKPVLIRKKPDERFDYDQKCLQLSEARDRIPILTDDQLIDEFKECYEFLINRKWLKKQGFTYFQIWYEYKNVPRKLCKLISYELGLRAIKGNSKYPSQQWFTDRLNACKRHVDIDRNNPNHYKFYVFGFIDVIASLLSYFIEIYIYILEKIFFTDET